VTLLRITPVIGLLAFALAADAAEPLGYSDLMVGAPPPADRR
jgi:hypothetical protein